MDETRCEKMKAKFKKTLQTVMLVTVLLYFSLLVYQSLSHGLTQAAQIPSETKFYDLMDVRSRGRDSRTKRVPGYVVNSVTSDIIPMVTATRKPPLTTLEDLFISVKTTKRFHNIRLPIILQTWFQLARNQTWFFTDTDDEDLRKKTNGHVINTSCSPTHKLKALCCKMSVELDTFLESDKDWFCHFDDDQYVNVPRLVQFLADYNSQEDWYFGKTSVPNPVEIVKAKKRKISFWFATGGAGFCLSRSLTLKMIPFASQGKFIRICEKVLFPDDVTMGYIIEHLLKKPLTVVDQFHSHLEPMKFLRRDQLHDQISFGYHVKNKDDWSNVLKIDGFSIKYDPTRFLSLHCFLFPYFNFCPK